MPNINMENPKPYTIQTWAYDIGYTMVYLYLGWSNITIHDPPMVGELDGFTIEFTTLLGVLNLTKTPRDGFLMFIIGCSFLMQFGVTHPRHGWTSKGILWTWNHDHCRNLFLHIFTTFLRSQGNQHKPQLDWRSDPLPNTAIPLKEQEERNLSDKRKKSVLGPL